MKKFIIAGICIFILAVSVGAYFYEFTSAKRDFIKQEHFRDEIRLKVNVYKNEKALRKVIKKRFPTDYDSNIIGFSVWNTINNRCEIFVTEAHSDNDFDTWGHEIAHCMYGRWHKE